MTNKFQNHPDPLRHLIKSSWQVQEKSAGTTPKTFRTIADGSPGLVFNRAQAALNRYSKKLPVVFLYGQGTAYAEIVSPGDLDLMGIYFQPHALRAIFGLDSAEITDSCLDLNDLSARFGYALSERLQYAVTLERQAQIIHEFLFLLLKQNSPKQDPLAAFAVSKIKENRGQITIRELQRSLHISERSLERKFLQHIGISPKLFLRINRFQNALSQIRCQDYDKLSDVAFDNDYADQSHFLRDFKAFTGLAPLQYLKQTRELVDNFSQLAS